VVIQRRHAAYPRVRITRISPQKKRGGPKAAPLATSTEKESYFFLDFFALHFWGGADADSTLPS
jgi:hypothetical protein